MAQSHTAVRMQRPGLLAISWLRVLFASPSVSLSLFFCRPNSPSSFLTCYRSQPCLHLNPLSWEGPNMLLSLTQWNPELNKLHPYHGVTQPEKNSETVTSFMLHLKPGDEVHSFSIPRPRSEDGWGSSPLFSQSS